MCDAKSSTSRVVRYGVRSTSLALNNQISSFQQCALQQLLANNDATSDILVFAIICLKVTERHVRYSERWATPAQLYSLQTDSLCTALPCLEVVHQTSCNQQRPRRIPYVLIHYVLVQQQHTTGKRMIKLACRWLGLKATDVQLWEWVAYTFAAVYRSNLWLLWQPLPIASAGRV